MASYIVREKLNEENKYNAGSKARQDVEKILTDEGSRPLDLYFEDEKDRKNQSSYTKIIQHIEMQRKWKKLFSQAQRNDVIYLQFPVKAHTVFLSRAIRFAALEGIKMVAIIHDIEYLRLALFYKENKKRSYRLKYEEMESIKHFYKIIVHNNVMKRLMVDRFNIPEEKIIVLGIFDYLIPNFIPKQKMEDCDDLIIAGNLDKDKCGYLYKMPNDITVSLYGANFSGTNSSNIHYNGAFLPEVLPQKMQGRFGFVWDGDDLDKCSGIFGEYLKYNNPHKTSLYLACGFPVIIWDKAALASFILDNHCGLVTDDICKIPGMLSKMTAQEYNVLCENASQIGQNMRSGYYLKKAIGAVEK